MTAKFSYESPYGNLTVEAVDGDRIVVYSDFDTPLVVNGVEIRTRWDLRHAEESDPASWLVVRGLHGDWGWHNYTTSRADYQNKSVSDSARRKIKAAVADALTAALATDILSDGAEEARKREIWALEREIAELETALATKVQKLRLLTDPS